MSHHHLIANYCHEALNYCVCGSLVLVLCDLGVAQNTVSVTSRKLDSHALEMLVVIWRPAVFVLLGFITQSSSVCQLHGARVQTDTNKRSIRDIP